MSITRVLANGTVQPSVPRPNRGLDSVNSRGSVASNRWSSDQLLPPRYPACGTVPLGRSSDRVGGHGPQPRRGTPSSWTHSLTSPLERSATSTRRSAPNPRTYSVCRSVARDFLAQDRGGVTDKPPQQVGIHGASAARRGWSDRTCSGLGVRRRPRGVTEARAAPRAAETERVRRNHLWLA